MQTFDVAFSRRMSCSRARQRGDVGVPALGVDGLADQPAGETAHLGLAAGEEAEVGAAEGERRAEGLALADHDVGPELAGRPQDPGGHGIGRHHHQCAVGVGHPPGLGQVLQAPQVVGVADGQHRRRLAVAFGPGRAPPVEAHLDDPVAGARGEGGKHRPPVRMDARRDPHPLAAGGPGGQVDRLDQGAGPVVEGGVGDRQAGQPRHHGLELEHRLQHPLGHLGLVRGVGGHELAAPGQGADHGGHLVVVGAGPGEADQPVRAGPVGPGQGLEVDAHVGLGPARRRGRAPRPPAASRAPRRTARRARRARGRRASEAISASVCGR